MAHFAARILSLASVLSSMNRACLGLYSDFILLAEEKELKKIVLKTIRAITENSPA